MHTSLILLIKTNTESTCFTPMTDVCATLIFAFKKVPMLLICKNVFQGPLIPFIHLLNVNSSGTIRGDIFMQCHFPSAQGVTDAFTPPESPIYNLVCCCLRQLAPCCFSTFLCCIMREAVPQWTLAAFLLHAVRGWFFLLASPYRSCHPAVICLLWISSPTVRIASLLKIWLGSRNLNLAILMNESFCQYAYSL